MQVKAPVVGPVVHLGVAPMHQLSPKFIGSSKRNVSHEAADHG